jgi:5-methylcytosine-specific restriction protein B
MSDHWISGGLLRSSLDVLSRWTAAVPTQKSRHVWSLLPPKFKGANSTTSISYAESDDRDFMDAFLKIRPENDDSPYYDPFSLTWLPDGYFHSNMATFRKHTFVRSWRAAEWDQDSLRLSEDYAEVFESKVLAKGGAVTKIPAVACAVFFYKRPSAEWPAGHPFANGVAEDAADLVKQFKTDFGFDVDSEWERIFDPDPTLLGDYSGRLQVSG